MQRHIPPAPTPISDLIETMIDAFEAMGLETERHDFFPYLPKFVSGGGGFSGGGGGGGGGGGW